MQVLTKWKEAITAIRDEAVVVIGESTAKAREFDGDAEASPVYRKAVAVRDAANTLLDLESGKLKPARKPLATTVAETKGGY